MENRTHWDSYRSAVDKKYHTYHQGVINKVIYVKGLDLVLEVKRHSDSLLQRIFFHEDMSTSPKSPVEVLCEDFQIQKSPEFAGTELVGREVTGIYLPFPDSKLFSSGKDRELLELYEQFPYEAFNVEKSEPKRDDVLIGIRKI